MALYLDFYGLRERPFKLTSNPCRLLLTPGHTEALSALQYGLGTRIGMMLLAGEAGTGKTTVVRAALASQPSEGRFVTISNPILTRGEFLEHLKNGFGLTASAAASKTALLEELTAVLADDLASRRPAALVLDEAHTAPFEILEEVRLLSNLEADDEKLLPVVLVGQPELVDRLNQPELRQLTQRIAVRASLGTLDLRETIAYVAGRIDLAGGQGPSIFTSGAVDVIHAASRGVPRTINVIGENALVAGFAVGERPIGVGTVLDVSADLDLRPPDPSTSASNTRLSRSVVSPEPVR